MICLSAPRLLIAFSAVTLVTFLFTPQHVLPLLLRIGVGKNKVVSNLPALLVANGKGPWTLPVKMQTSIPMYYINLDRSARRLEHMERTFSRWGNLTRIRAIDASDRKELSDAVDLAGYSLERWKSKGFIKGFGELALFATTMHAIRVAYENGDEVMLLLQDDASDILVPFWRQTLDDLVSAANAYYPGWDAIQLQVAAVRKFPTYHDTLYDYWKSDPAKMLYRHSELPLRYSQQTSGAVAQLFSRKGMQRYLDRFQTYRTSNNRKNDDTGSIDNGSDNDNVHHSNTSDNDRYRLQCFPYVDRLRRRCTTDHQLWSTTFETFLALPPFFTYVVNEGSTGLRSSGFLTKDKEENDHKAWHYVSILDSLRANLEAVALHNAPFEVREDVQVSDLYYVVKHVEIGVGQ